MSVVVGCARDGDKGRLAKRGRKKVEANLAEAIRRRFAPLGGADDIELPPRERASEPPRFD